MYCSCSACKLGIIGGKFLHHACLYLADSGAQLLFLLRYLGERGAYLGKAGGGGGLHHIAVFFGYGIAVVCFGCLEILIQRAEHGQLPAIILAAAHYGKGVVIVLAVGSSALVLHLIEKIPLHGNYFFGGVDDVRTVLGIIGAH